MSQHSDSIPISPRSAVSNVASDLRSSDWEKLIFLCSPWISDDDERRIFSSFESFGSNFSPEFNLNQLIYAIRTQNQIVNNQEDIKILQELLFLIKKFRTLKNLSSCQHGVAKQLKDQKSYIQPLWVFLFHIVEELLDEPLKFIAVHFKYPGVDNLTNKPLGFIFSRKLFRYLIEKKEISDSDVSKLNDVFAHYLKKKDLVDKTLEYIKSVNCYKIDAGRIGFETGYAVIFNHYKFDKVPPQGVQNKTDLEIREGTNKDAEKLKKLWSSYGMKTVIHQDLCSIEFNSEIFKLAKEMNYDKYKIFVCCVLSHGEKDYIYASDGVKVKIETIHSSFGEHAGSLSGKPKLFFIQACQGDDSNRLIPDAARENELPIEEQPVIHEPPEYYRSPKQADILIGKSTVPGYKSWRHEQNGSVYIQNLVEILENRGDKDELLQLMTDVNSAVSKTKINRTTCQMPSITHQFTKQLYLKRAISYTSN